MIEDLKINKKTETARTVPAFTYFSIEFLKYYLASIVT